jgi:hypothetical protein
VTEPGESDELRARLERVEDDARAARTLAGGADRDTAELRTELREFRTQNNRLLTAMRADLTDLRADLSDLRERTERGFALVDQNFLAIRGVLDGLAANQQTIIARLGPDRGGGMTT